MSAFRDFEDKSVEKAIDKACAQLNISRSQLQYDIISHGSSGIFGLVGAKKALIRVSVPETGSPEEPQQKAERSAEVSAVSALVDEAFGPLEDVEEGEGDTGEDEDATQEVDDTAEEEVEEPVAEHQPVPVDPEKREQLSEWVTGFLAQVIALISPDAAVSVFEENEVTRFAITGGDAARLIGKRGQTLEAIQYLVEKAVIKRFGALLPVEIDVEGYLDKRRADLTALAERLAHKAQQTGKPMVINRINAQDRRIVHLSLKENRSVRTQSVGNGDYRKLLILPKKKGGPKKGRNKAKKPE